MLKALVLDAFSRAGLEMIQSLGRRGVLVHASSPSDCRAFSSRYVVQRWEQPTIASTDRYVEWLRRIEAQHGYSLVVPSTEYSLLPLTDLPEDDPLKGILQLPARESIFAALDKWRTLRLASSCGIPIPPSRAYNSPADLLPPDSFPVVLKSTRSIIRVAGIAQQTQAFLAQDFMGWKQAVFSLLPQTPVIEQPRLRGRGVGIEVLYRNGQMVWYFAHRRLHEGSGQNGLGGGSSYRRSIAAPRQALAYTTALLDRLRWHGVAMVEFLETFDGDYYLMEINPRLWGSLALAIDAGVDFPWALFLMATGQPIPPQPEYRVPYYTRDPVNDFRWILGSIRSRPVKGLRNIMGLARVFVGRESWDHFDWRDLGVTGAALREFLRGTIRYLASGFSQSINRRRAKRIHDRNLARFRSRHQACRRVLFLCYGNICRSPVAEQLARREMPELTFSSAGLHAEPGRPSPLHLQGVGRAAGIDLSNFKSQTVSAEMVEQADLIILMDTRNLFDLSREFPAALHKVLLLGMFASSTIEINDPYGASLREIIAVFQQVQAGVAGLAKELGAAPVD